eukprot:Ihof_evm1s515 gene=Ihof_evmTU1s515
MESPQVPQQEWVDITSQFTQLAGQLPVGKLAHSSRFTTFEAISALEMMDSKMDVGVAYASDPNRILSIEDALRRKIVKCRDFSLHEVVGIMDQLIASEATWLDGQPLPQTVFTCMYVSCPTMIVDQWLHAYCVGVGKTVEVMIGIMMRADVAHEEDFQLKMCSMRRASNEEHISNPRTVGLLKEAIKDVTGAIKKEKGRDEERLTLLEGVRHRLEYRAALLEALLALEAPMCSQMAQASTHLQKVQTHLEALALTLPMGLKPASEKEPMMGFEPSLNYRQLPPAPAAKVVHMARDKAIKYMAVLTGQLQQLEVLHPSMTMKTLKLFMDDYTRQVPIVLARAVLNITYYHGRRWFGKVFLADVVKQELYDFMRPPYLEPGFKVAAKVEGSPEQAVQGEVDYFMHNLVKAALEYLQIFCFNRARQHRRLTKYLEHLSVIQLEAKDLDDRVARLLEGGPWALPMVEDSVFVHYMGTWVLYCKLDAMARYLEYGFELSLYGPHEVSMIYWYMDNLYGWMISADIRMVQHCHSMEEHWKAQKRVMKIKVGKRKKGKDKAQPLDTVEKGRGPSTMILEVRQVMCRGLCRAAEGLDIEKRLKKPTTLFDLEMVRYDRRLEPFFRIDSPQPMEYAQFKAQTDLSKFTAAQIYQGALECMSVCKTHLEKMAQKYPDIDPGTEKTQKGLEKVCKVNIVMLKLLKDGYKQEEK